MPRPSKKQIQKKQLACARAAARWHPVVVDTTADENTDDFSLLAIDVSDNEDIAFETTDDEEVGELQNNSMGTRIRKLIYKNLILI